MFRYYHPGRYKISGTKKGAHKNILPVHYNRKKKSSLLANNFIRRRVSPRQSPNPKGFNKKESENVMWDIIL